MSFITPKTLSELSSVAIKAGQYTLEYRKNNLIVEYKQDGSPVTQADQEAEALILQTIRSLCPDVKIIAEEEKAAGLSPALGTDQEDRYFFLVDALDGTKSYAKGENDFTVNIALIDGNQPILGIIYCPGDDALFVGHHDQAYKIDQCSKNGVGTEHQAPLALPPLKRQSQLRVVASKSHRNKATDTYIKQLGNVDFVAVGSSKKFCTLAEGKADLYPRFSPTSEWDIAAGDALLRAAGGFTVTLKGQDYCYRKPNFLNGNFIAGVDWAKQMALLP